MHGKTKNNTFKKVILKTIGSTISKLIEKWLIQITRL